MIKFTISEAVKVVLKSEGKPLHINDIQKKITDGNYYQFKSKNPVSVVSTEIRRHCEGEKQASNREIYFKKLTNGSYWLID